MACAQRLTGVLSRSQKFGNCGARFNFMSLLLLDPDTAASEKLSKQLSDLGLNVLTTANVPDATKLCALGGVRVLVCSDYDQISQLNDLPVGVGLVFASRAPLSLDVVLACLQVGVQDCWQLPMSGIDMQPRISAITRRMEKWLAESNGELHAMRVELERDQRAGQYIQLGMLPPNPMGIGHFTLQHRVEPSLILSGDFVDYFQVTDPSGKKLLSEDPVKCRRVTVSDDGVIVRHVALEGCVDELGFDHDDRHERDLQWGLHAGGRGGLLD